MSIKTLVDQSKKEPKITLRCEFQAADNEHAKAVDKLAQKCADELELAMIGQVKLPMGEPEPATTVAGTADGVVVTASDKAGVPNPDDPPGGDEGPELPMSDGRVEEPEAEAQGGKPKRKRFGDRGRPVAHPAGVA